MKKALLLLTVVSLTNTSCVKELFKKKDDDTAVVDNYVGTWRAYSGAVDLNSNNIIDPGETTTLSGSSELSLTTDNKFTYYISSGTGTTSMNGTWSKSTDNKSVTITDAAAGSIRFDYRTDTEIQTEPIATTNGTVWLIYKKQ